jgi:hypothetical protein
MQSEKTSMSAPVQAVVSLVREYKHGRFLEVVGAVCQLQRKWESEPCGGSLRVEDWRDEVAREWRYELFCDKCKTCDSDGWRTQAQVIDAAKRFGASG